FSPHCRRRLAGDGLLARLLPGRRGQHLRRHRRRGVRPPRRAQVEAGRHRPALLHGVPLAVPPTGGTATEAPPPQLLHPEGAASVPSICSSDRANVIADDGGVPCHEDPVAAETERIKAVLLNDQEKSEATLLELLRRLQQLELTVDTLTVTEIGKAVSSYRKHNSKQIRHLVQLLIEGWKRILDEWMSS
ncbi:Os06g0315900, partial [Oryza sativa Japonica Group]